MMSVSADQRLLISNAPSHFLKERVIKLHFSRFGTISSVVVNKNKRNCIVTFNKPEQAEFAKKNGRHWKNCKLDITYAPESVTAISSNVVDTSCDIEGELDWFAVEDYNMPSSSTDPLMIVDHEMVEPKEAYKRSEDSNESQKKKMHLMTEEANEFPLKKTDNRTEIKTRTNEEDLAEELLAKTASTLNGRLSVLEERDKLIRIHISKNSNIKTAVTIKGTCPDMCPEKERILRVVRGMVASYESIDGSNIRMDHGKAVKDYARSSADQEEPLPHELRPEPVLSMTMDYLITQIMTKIDTDEEDNFGNWYDFCWYRLRSIRKDIIQQQLCDRNTVEIVEKCARFHICCFDRLWGVSKSIFDDKINSETLMNCLQSLMHMYEDLRKQGVTCPNEAEFRAYLILLKLNSGFLLSEYQQYSSFLQKSAQVKDAVLIHTAYSNNMYSTYFSLMKKTSYLNCCLMQRFLAHLRTKALEIIVRAHCPPNKMSRLPINFISQILKFDTRQDCIHFCESFGLGLAGDSYHFIVSRNEFFFPESLFIIKTPSSIVVRKRVSVAKAVVGINSDLPIYIPHEVHSSFNEDGSLKEDALDASDQEEKLFRDIVERKWILKKATANVAKLVTIPEETRAVSTIPSSPKLLNKIIDFPKDAEPIMINVTSLEPNDYSNEKSVVVEDISDEDPDLVGHLSENASNASSSSEPNSLSELDSHEIPGSGPYLDLKGNILADSTSTVLNSASLPTAISLPPRFDSVLPNQDVPSSTPEISNKTETITPQFSFLKKQNEPTILPDFAMSKKEQVTPPTLIGPDANQTTLLTFSSNEVKLPPPLISSKKPQITTPTFNFSKNDQIFPSALNSSKISFTTPPTLNLSAADQTITPSFFSVKKGQVKPSAVKSSKQGPTSLQSLDFIQTPFCKKEKSPSVQGKDKEYSLLAKLRKTKSSEKIKKETLRKYALLWRKKVQKLKKLTDRSHREYLFYWGAPNQNAIKQSGFRKRMYQKKKTNLVVLSILHSGLVDRIDPSICKIGEILTEALGRVAINSFRKEGSFFQPYPIFWKLIFALPPSLKGTFTFPDKLSNWCKAAFYADPNAKLGDVQYKMSSEGVPIFISVNVTLGDQSLAELGRNISAGVVIRASGWENLEETNQRCNQLVSLTAYKVPLAILTLGDDFKPCGQFRNRDKLSYFFESVWNDTDLLVKTLLNLAQHTCIYSHKVNSLRALILLFSEKLFDLLHEDRYINDSLYTVLCNPNNVIRFYNELIDEIEKEIVACYVANYHGIACEFEQIMKNNYSEIVKFPNHYKNINFRDIIKKHLQIARLTEIKWPFNNSKDLLETFTNYCHNIGCDAILSKLIRIINPPDSDDKNKSLSEHLERIPWLRIVEDLIKEVLNHNVFQNYVLIREKKIFELIDSHWWMNSDIVIKS